VSGTGGFATAVGAVLPPFPQMPMSEVGTFANCLLGFDCWRVSVRFGGSSLAGLLIVVYIYV
jgi:hypothetical protein